MAMVESGHAEPGRRLELAGRGGSGSVEIAPLPFYRGSVRQASRT
jgi:hypothetical protein